MDKALIFGISNVPRSLTRLLVWEPTEVSQHALCRFESYLPLQVRRGLLRRCAQLNEPTSFAPENLLVLSCARPQLRPIPESTRAVEGRCVPGSTDTVLRARSSMGEHSTVHAEKLSRS